MLDRVKLIKPADFNVDNDETDDETIANVVDEKMKKHPRMPTHVDLGDESVWEKDDMDIPDPDTDDPTDDNDDTDNTNKDNNDDDNDNNDAGKSFYNFLSVGRSISK